MSIHTPQDAHLLYLRWQHGDLKATGLEAKARIILGWDQGEAEDLTAEEREEMTRFIARESMDYCREDCAAMNDRQISEVWISTMLEYVDDLY